MEKEADLKVIADFDRESSHDNPICKYETSSHTLVIDVGSGLVATKPLPRVSSYLDFS